LLLAVGRPEEVFGRNQELWTIAVTP